MLIKLVIIERWVELDATGVNERVVSNAVDRYSAKRALDGLSRVSAWNMRARCQMRGTFLRTCNYLQHKSLDCIHFHVKIRKMPERNQQIQKNSRLWMVRILLQFWCGPLSSNGCCCHDNRTVNISRSATFFLLTTFFFNSKFNQFQFDEVSSSSLETFRLGTAHLFLLGSISSSEIDLQFSR